MQGSSPCPSDLGKERNHGRKNCKGFLDNSWNFDIGIFASLILMIWCGFIFGLKLVFTCLVVTMFFKLLAKASEEIDS